MSLYAQDVGVHLDKTGNYVLSPDGALDNHIKLTQIPAGRTISTVNIQDMNHPEAQWQQPQVGPPQYWYGILVEQVGSIADLWFSTYLANPQFRVTVTYDDNSQATVDSSPNPDPDGGGTTTVLEVSVVVPTGLVPPFDVKVHLVPQA